jgi:zinc protease
MTTSIYKRLFGFLAAFSFIGVALVSTTVFAQAATTTPLAGVPIAPKPPEGAIWPWEGSDLKSDPSITYGVLPNGMRYAIRPNKLPEGSVVLRFRLEAGSKYERDDQRGFAHFIEHMVFNGSTNIPEGELVKTMERLGSSFGSDVNAHVSFDEAMYKLDLPRADGGRLETALKVFRETADRLLFEEAAVKREMGVVLSEMNDGDTPYRRVSRRTSAFTRPDDLRTKREPIGVRAVVEGATGAKLREFYDAYYRPDRAILVIAGDVDVDATKAMIATMFSDWKPKNPSEPAEPDDGTWPKAELRALIQVEPDLPTVLSVAAMRPDEFDYGDLDTEAGQKFWLLHGLASDIFERRLTTMQLVDNPPATAVGFDQSGADNGWTASLWITPREQDWERGLRAVVTELRQALDGGFNAAEIAEAIKERRVGYDRALAEAPTRRTAALAGSVMSALSNDSVYLTPEDRKRLFEEVAATATPENLKEAFRLWWRDVDPAIVLMTKTPLAGGEEALKAAWHTAMTMPIPERTRYVRAAFVPPEVGAPGRIVSTNVRRDPEAKIATFANGVTLAFKPTKFTADRVSISVTYGAGALAFPMTDPYWPMFTSASWNGDGVGTLTRDQMITALAGRSTSLASVGVNYATASLGASPAKADMSEQLQVMLAQVREPRLGPRAASLIRDQLRSAWDSIGLTASGLFSFNSSTFFYQGTPMFEPPELARYLASNDADGKSHLQSILVNAPINVTIVGDTTWEAAREAVAATFGALPPRTGIEPGFAQLAPWTNVPTGGPARVLRHKGAQTQAIAHVSWLTPGSKNVQASNDFYVLSQVLQLRLTAKVREAAGESYSPDGGWASENLVDKGRLYAHASVTPDHVTLVNDMIDVIASDLGRHGPTTDEIQRVIGPMLEGRARARQTNGYWAGLLSYIGLPQAPGYQKGDPLVLQAGLERRMRSITRAKLKRLAARYMVPSNAIRVQVLPTPVPTLVPPIDSAPIPIG